MSRHTHCGCVGLLRSHRYLAWTRPRQCGFVMLPESAFRFSSYPERATGLYPQSTKSHCLAPRAQSRYVRLSRIRLPPWMLSRLAPPSHAKVPVASSSVMRRCIRLVPMTCPLALIAQSP
jgi:hypothetical protein